MRPITPINQIERRLPEQGRIRFGEKSEKGAPKKLTTFRFTSLDKEAIAEIAGLYGGTVKAWTDMPGQWQVTSTASEIPVVLPPDPLGGSPVYELWLKGGVQRRCDGEICLAPQNTPQGAELVERPCICSEKGLLECKPKTRLTVILPEVRFGGGWRIESGGWNVAHELPGMVDMIEALQARGLQRAVLALEPRKSTFNGQTRLFVVPVLRPAVSVNAMLEGAGTVKALAAAPVLEDRTYVLSVPEGGEAAADVWQDPWEDTQIVDAEIVGEVGNHHPGPEATALLRDSTAEVSVKDPASPTSDGVEKRRRKMHAMLKELGMGVTERHALVKRITNGRTESSNDLDESGLDVMLAALEAMKKAEAFYDGVDANGFAIVTRSPKWP